MAGILTHKQKQLVPSPSPRMAVVLGVVHLNRQWIRTPGEAPSRAGT